MPCLLTTDPKLIQAIIETEGLFTFKFEGKECVCGENQRRFICF